LAGQRRNLLPQGDGFQCRDNFRPAPNGILAGSLPGFRVLEWGRSNVSSLRTTFRRVDRRRNPAAPSSVPGGPRGGRNTVFHKLNLDFINPEVSCGTRLGADLLGVVGIRLVPAFLAPFFVASTLAVELALPFDLLFNRLRTATAILGLIFHWILGVAGYSAFPQP
jgi:hypothetical protein